MKNKIWITILIIVILIVLVVVFSFQRKEEETIKIGVIAPLSGKFAFWGENIKNSLELAVGEINGKGNENVQLIFQDSKCNSQEAVSSVNKLINIDKVEIIIGGVCSSATLAAAPIAEENQVILLTPVSQSSDIKNAGDYIFRIALPNDKASKILAHRVYSDGNKKAAILYVLNDLGQDYNKHFSESFKDIGGEIVSMESYEVSEKDFSSALTKIKQSDPDALIIFTNLEGSLIAKKIQEFGLEIALYGAPTWNSKPNVLGVEAIVEGLIYPLNRLDFNDSRYIEFVKRYKDKYGEVPSVPWMAVNSYDAIEIVLKVISEKGYGGEKIKNQLYKTQNHKGIGGTISFDKNGESLNEVQLMIIKNGKGVKLNQ